MLKEDINSMAMLTPVYNWMQQHRIASIVIIILLLLVVSGIWWVRPAAFAVTHTNMQDCGDIVSPIGPQSSVDSTKAMQVIQCFVQAHQQCRAASLAYTSHGVDAGTTETFYTANGLAQCGLSVQTTTYVIPVTSHTSEDNCSGMVQKPDGLHFLSCGDARELVVPAR
jgi:hypothetical protein